MPSFALLAAGHDRPGIVAAVTRVLVGLGVNLADTSMSSLRGTFAMVLVVDAPDDVGALELEQALAPVAASLDLVVAVRPASSPGEASAPAGERYVLTVYGGDHPGIVHGITRRLADRGANVVDLETHVIGPTDRPVYAMVLGLELPPSTDVEGLRGDLDAAAEELGVSCTLRSADADIL